MSHGIAGRLRDLAIFGHGANASLMSENGERGTIGRDTLQGEDITTMTTTTQYVYKTMRSPVGTLTLIASDKGLAGVWFERSRPERVRTRTEVENRTHPILVETERQ